MTTDEQRIAIAEWMGELEPNKCKPSIEQLEAIIASKNPFFVITLESSGEVRSIRDYPNDLNAIHEAEKKLSGKEILGYVINVLSVTGSSGFSTVATTSMGDKRGWDEISGVACWNFVHATAPQRSEALCRTLWPERFEK
jgi:hypothetical protein